MALDHTAVLPGPPPESGRPKEAGLIRIRDKKRVLTSAFAGTTIEWYDFYLYGFASALIFNDQFFPHSSALAGILASFASFASFATFAVGFLARPLGGVIAGHLGDRIGRKKLLVISLLTMGIASTLIGVLPTYGSAGGFAVVGLVVLRLLQGLSAGAEWGGSALLSVEHAPRHLRGLFGSFTQVGSSAGMLLATGAFTISQAVMSTEAFHSFGWRIPFLLSAVLVGVGLYIRLGVEDTPEFKQLRETEKIEASPVREVLRNYPRGVFVTIGLRLGQIGLFVLLTVYVLGYLSARREDDGVAITSILIVSAIGLAGGPFWGWLSDKVGRRRLALSSAVATGIFVWPFFWFLDIGPLVLLPLVMIVGINILHDSMYGVQAAWFAEQFPLGVRYSGVSLGYQVGAVLGGGLTPFIAAALLEIGGGAPWLICAYIMALAALSAIAAAAAKDPVRDRLRDTTLRDTF